MGIFSVIRKPSNVILQDKLVHFGSKRQNNGYQIKINLT